MTVEKTIEFLPKNQARMDARFNAKFDRADKRLDRLERVVALNNRVVTRLVRYGVSLRSDVRRLTMAQAATDRALKALIQTRCIATAAVEQTPASTGARERGQA